MYGQNVISQNIFNTIMNFQTCEDSVNYLTTPKKIIIVKGKPSAGKTIWPLNKDPCRHNSCNLIIKFTCWNLLVEKDIIYMYVP